MKKILIALCALFVLFAFAIPCLAEISPTEGDTAEDAQELPSISESATVEDYASQKSIAEYVQDYLLEHWDAVAVFIYIIYKILPKIGGIARSRKQASDFNKAMETYFGDEKSEKNVFSVQKSVAKAQELFMNDAAAMLEKIREAVAPIKDFIEQSKNTEAARAATAEIALAVESAVELMASQLNDLVFASPAVSAKRKEEIDKEWSRKIQEIHAKLEKVVEAHDGENKVQAD